MFVTGLFALPETLFDRPPAVGNMDENLTSSPKAEVAHVESSANARGEPYTAPPMLWRAYIKHLYLWDHERSKGGRMKASDFVVKPLGMLQYPSVAFPALF